MTTLLTSVVRDSPDCRRFKIGRETDVLKYIWIDIEITPLEDKEIPVDIAHRLFKKIAIVQDYTRYIELAEVSGEALDLLSQLRWNGQKLRQYRDHINYRLDRPVCLPLPFELNIPIPNSLYLDCHLNNLAELNIADVVLRPHARITLYANAARPKYPIRMLVETYPTQTHLISNNNYRPTVDLRYNGSIRGFALAARQPERGWISAIQRIELTYGESMRSSQPAHHTTFVEPFFAAENCSELVHYYPYASKIIGPLDTATNYDSIDNVSLTMVVDVNPIEIVAVGLTNRLIEFKDQFDVRIVPHRG